MTSRAFVAGFLLLSAACARTDAPPPIAGTSHALSFKAPAAEAIVDQRSSRPGGRQAAAMTTESFRRMAPEQPVDPISYLAYAYAMSLELPGDHLARTMDAHAAACRAAGLRVCQVVTAQREGDPASHVRGTLSLRAEPRWLERFMTNVDGDARGAGGRLVSKSTTTEDLTRAIIDTEAALRAKRTLRGRLEQLLASRPGKLADLLEVERELARVQTEIDSTDSNLAVMRTRVAMSELTVLYTSAARAVAGDTFAPLHRAVSSFIGTAIHGVAAIVTIVAMALPWAIVSLLAAWVVLWSLRRRATDIGSPEPPSSVIEPPSPSNA